MIYCICRWYICRWSICRWFICRWCVLRANGSKPHHQSFFLENLYHTWYTFVDVYMNSLTDCEMNVISYVLYTYVPGTFFFRIFCCLIVDATACVRPCKLDGCLAGRREWHHHPSQPDLKKENAYLPGTFVHITAHSQTKIVPLGTHWNYQ